MNRNVFLGAAFIVLATPVIAQEVISDQQVNELEEVVLSDSKFALKREKSGKVITKITSEELEKSQGQTLAQVLNRVAGVRINGSQSAAGTDLGVYVRGGRNRQVLIRIDGLTVNDPSSSANDFDLRLIALNQIESIEILKGASSTLYGSGAATAVINIVTKAESKKEIAAQFSSRMGTNQSQEDQNYNISEFFNSASFNGTLDKVSYAASFDHQFTDGLSAAEAEGAESDAFSKYNVYAKLGYQWNKNFKFHFFGNLDEFSSDFDAGAETDANNRFTSQQLRGGSFWEVTYPNGSFTFTDSYALLERAFFSDFPSRYESRLYTFDAYNKYKFGDVLYTVLGVNGSYSDFNLFTIPFGEDELTQTINDKEADFDITDPYINLVYTSAFGMNLNAGARLNMHSVYGNHLVYSVNPSYTYTFENNFVKALASYSTAYITPSLFQLYDTAFNSGNPDLEPEESRTIEGGLELSLEKNITASVVYFDRSSENFITFNPSTFVNFNSPDVIEVDGIEVETAFTFLQEKITLNGKYTYTNISRLENDIRIPEHSVQAGVAYQPSAKTYFSLQYQYAGERSDSNFNDPDPETFAPAPVSLESYGLLDFYMSQQISKNVSVNASVSNITNADYQEIFGFSTRGRNVSAGFRLEF